MTWRPSGRLRPWPGGRRRWRGLGVELEPQAGPWPPASVELAGGGGGAPGVRHIGPAEADVGAEQVREREVLRRAVGVEGGDAAVDDGGHADLAAGLDGQAVQVV